MNDRDVLRTIEASRVMRALAAALGRVRQIAETSMTVSRVRSLRQWWNHESSLSKRRAVGILLVTAGSVHMLLRAADPPPGWLWIVVPVWGVVVGALLVAGSSTALHEGKS